jgi:hypothetical protein
MGLAGRVGGGVVVPRDALGPLLNLAPSDRLEVSDNIHCERQKVLFLRLHWSLTKKRNNHWNNNSCDENELGAAIDS